MVSVPAVSVYAPLGAYGNILVRLLWRVFYRIDRLKGRCYTANKFESVIE